MTLSPEDFLAKTFPQLEKALESRANALGFGEKWPGWLGEVRPRFVFVENSPMLTSRGLYRVLGDLAELGYNARWCVLGADDTGAPHRRKRIWILGLHRQVLMLRVELFLMRTQR